MNGGWTAATPAVLAAAAAGAGTAARAAATYAANLDWGSVAPAKYAYAGTRGLPRSDAEARAVWESIPPQVRAQGPEHTLDVLDGMDWSHIIPRSAGGGDAASNGVFEIGSINRARGADPMTPAELNAANGVLHGKAFAAAVTETASNAGLAAGAGAATAAVLALLEEGLEYKRGRVGGSEMLRRVASRTAGGATASAVTSGLLTAAVMAFPALAAAAWPVLAAVAAVGLAGLLWRARAAVAAWYAELKRDRAAETPAATAAGLAGGTLAAAAMAVAVPAVGATASSASSRPSRCFQTRHATVCPDVASTQLPF